MCHALEDVLLPIHTNTLDFSFALCMLNMVHDTDSCLSLTYDNGTCSKIVSCLEMPRQHSWASLVLLGLVKGPQAKDVLERDLLVIE